MNPVLTSTLADDIATAPLGPVDLPLTSVTCIRKPANVFDWSVVKTMWIMSPVDWYSEWSLPQNFPRFNRLVPSSAIRANHL